MRKTVERVVVFCKHCHTAFSVPHWEPAQGKGKYCSVNCKNRGRSQTAPSTPVSLTCQQCGAAFTKPAWALKKAGRGKYCSSPCAAAGRRINPNAADRQYPDKPKPNVGRHANTVPPLPASPRVDDLPLTECSGLVRCARCSSMRERGVRCSCERWTPDGQPVEGAA